MVPDRRLVHQGEETQYQVEQKPDQEKDERGCEKTMVLSLPGKSEDKGGRKDESGDERGKVAKEFLQAEKEPWP